jgi:hypothetical protein
MIGVAIIVLGCIAALSGAAHAQTQSTLGPCSPAIAGVGRDVNVTCIQQNRRIRIARYAGRINSETGEKFVSFLRGNTGKLVYIDTSADMGADLYQHFINNSVDSSFLVLPVRSQPVNCETVFECPDQWTIFFNDPGKRTTAYVEHGSWRFRGYYVVKEGSYGQGTSELYMSPVDENSIIMSDKYNTE